MSTSVLPRASARSLAVTDRRFYLVMAVASASLIFVGFSHSYYRRAPAYQGYTLTPLVHVHAAVFTLWMIYFVLQTALITVQRPALHRKLGIVGAVLGSAMIVLGLTVAFTALRLNHGSIGQDPEVIFLVALGDIFTFALFFIAGYLQRRDRQAHQRLMLLAVAVGLTGAAIGRLPSAGVPAPALSLIFFAFLLAGPLYDLVTRRRIHPVYIYGCLFAIATMTPLRFVLGATPWWHHLAHQLAGL